MKKASVFALVLVFGVSFLFAQEIKTKSGSIGFSYNFGIFQEDRRQNSNRYSSAGGTYDDDYYIEKTFYTIGISYIKPFNSWLEYETGLEYSRKVASLKTVFPFDDFIVRKANSTLISLPITLKANFLRFFFVNSGLLFDLNAGGYLPARYQSGLGCILGIAAKYDFKCGTSLFVNPYFKRRSFVSFSSDEELLKMEEVGIRVGLSFKLHQNNQ